MLALQNVIKLTNGNSMKRLFLFLAIGLMTAQCANAANLMDIYQKALTSDPTFQEALAKKMSDAEATPADLAVLLPTVKYTGSAALQKTITHSTITSNSTARTRTLGWTLSLTQSVFNFTNWKNLAAARDSVKAADATYNAAAQNLMTRVVNAYFAVLNAQDVLTYTAAEKRAFYREYQQAQQGYKVGVNTITDVYNAKASYDGAASDYVSAQNNLSSSREDLRAITGVLYDHTAPLAQSLPLVGPEPHDIDAWVDISNKQNWNIVAARYKALSAHNDAWAARGGHLPTVSATAQYDHSYARNFDTGRAQTKGPSAELDLTVPLFSGGSVTSATRKAIADYEYLLQKQEETYRAVNKRTRQDYLSVMSDISKVKADNQTIISNQSSLESMKQGYKVGTRTIVDVLNAEETLYNAKKTWSADRYDYIKKTISLKEAAGTLNANDLQIINTWLSSEATAPTQTKTPAAAIGKQTYLQIGAYYNERIAQDILAKIKKQTTAPAEIDTQTTTTRKIYRVQAGPLTTNGMIQKTKIQLKQAGFSDILIVEK